MNVPDDDVPNPILREEDDTINLDDIPDVGISERESGETQRLGKRSRKDSEDALFVDQASESDDGTEAMDAEISQRKRLETDMIGEGEDQDKKKLGFNTSYDGFSIYGRILCLVVKRRGGKAKTGLTASDNAGQQMLENWVSTQAAQDQAVEDDDEG